MHRHLQVVAGAVEVGAVEAVVEAGVVVEEETLIISITLTIHTTMVTLIMDRQSIPVAHRNGSDQGGKAIKLPRMDTILLQYCPLTRP